MEPYRVHLVVCEWGSTYPGELAPGVVAAIDEYSLEQNDEAWEMTMCDARKIAGDDAPLARLVVTIDRAAVDAALNPSHPHTTGTTTQENQ